MRAELAWPIMRESGGAASIHVGRQTGVFRARATSDGTIYGRDQSRKQGLSAQVRLLTFLRAEIFSVQDFRLHLSFLSLVVQ